MRRLTRMYVMLDLICVGSVDLQGREASQNYKMKILVYSGILTHARHGRLLLKPRHDTDMNSCKYDFKVYWIYISINKLNMYRIIGTGCVLLNI